MSTEIQWTDETWNPVTGCSKVSPGCAHCYAERVASRLWSTQYPRVVIEGGITSALRDSVQSTRPRQFTDVQCHEDRLDQPLRWKKARKVFVNSMSDLFHEDVPDAFIDRVFAVMALAPQHTFQILTKRAERMRAYMSAGPDVLLKRWADAVDFETPLDDEARGELRSGVDLDTVELSFSERRWSDLRNGTFPLKNVWLGVSVENQRFADERIPLLLQTPAAIRFISAEPLLGPVDLEAVPLPGAAENWYGLRGVAQPKSEKDTEVDDWKYWTRHGAKLDWVIVGGESGTGARPFDVAWARAIVQQCQAAGVPVFVKQLGADPRGEAGVDYTLERNERGFPLDESRAVRANGGLLLRDRKGGDLAEWPSDLRVREIPAVAWC